MSIRAVLFDLDNTLIREDESTYGALDAAARLAAARVAVDARALSDAARAAAAARWAAAPEHAFGDAFGIWWGELLWGGFSGGPEAIAALRRLAPEFRRAVWRDALAASGVRDDSLADDLAREYIRARRSAESIDPEAEPLLRGLAPGHRLALVTNGAGDVQREKLSRTSFAPFFSQIVISVEAGVGKPDPELFRIAARGLGVAPGEAVMVGDSLARDIGGAKAAGMRAVWIDRRLWEEDEAVRPDARIERLSDLPAALAGLEPGPSSPGATT